MATLAPKLPYQHPFAGGYPGRGGQALPTDPDAIDYLNRVAAADGGASVEVGIAQAIDAFVRGCKADGTWDAIQASCIMCGARTLSGALVPLKGTAPTPYNFASGDYSRSGTTPGLKGNGSTKYLDTNRASNADGQDDNHQSVYVSTLPATTGTTLIGNYSASGTKGSLMSVEAANAFGTRCNNSSLDTSATASVGLCGINRESSSEYDKRTGGTTSTVVAASLTPTSITNTVFALNGDSSLFGPYKTDGRLAFYSVGAALDLALLDNRVSNLITEIAAAIP